MKRVEAVIQPHKLEAVKEALNGASITGLMVTEIRGHGRQKGHTEIYRGQEYKVDLLPKIRIETVIPDGRLEEVIGLITDAARSGKIGDGKIFVSEVTEAIRIRNGDRGDDAL